MLRNSHSSNPMILSGGLFNEGNNPVQVGLVLHRAMDYSFIFSRDITQTVYSNTYFYTSEVVPNSGPQLGCHLGSINIP